MKKLILKLVAVAIAAVSVFSFAACTKQEKIYVDTNAYFAPFEYYGGESGTEIVGVDVDIMNLVGKKLDKEVVFENTDFDVIIDNVALGKKYDCGAAGITITDARKEKVDFSNPYFTSVQYVICKTGALTSAGKSEDAAKVDYVLWSQLGGKKIGVQRDTTGDIYVAAETGADEDEKYVGELEGKNSEGVQYDSAQLAADAVKANLIDVVVVDKLPAQYIVSKNDGLECFALYYDASTATEEQYAICVTKGDTELLNAINEVLAELGENGVNDLVSKHFGLK